MELRHLRCFVAVVRSRSFSAAAEQLGRTQQAVGTGIALLESTPDRTGAAASPGA